MNLGRVKIASTILLLSGCKTLPDDSRSLGRSLRIYEGETKGMKIDDVRGRHAAPATLARGALAGPTSVPGSPAGGDLIAQLRQEAQAAEAQAAEARAAELRPCADLSRAAEGAR
ncbi:MAG: twin-arginine translocase TatA/TatE family subunit [Blastococcus sp.]